MSGNSRAPGPPERPGKHANTGKSAAESRGPADSRFVRRRPGRGAGNENVGWVIVSYLVTGMVVYGGLGWLIGHLIGVASVATLIGLLVGLALAVILVIFRYGRS